MKPWQSPSWIEVKMDAEISSYQEDPPPWRDDPLHAPHPGPTRTANLRDVHGLPTERLARR